MNGLGTVKGLVGAAALGALCLGFAPTTASALAIGDYMFPNTLWNDESGESLTVDTNGNGKLDVGDTLRGILHINQANNQGNGGSIIPAANNNEITMIFEAQVASKVAQGLNTFGVPVFNFSFEPIGGLNGTGFLAPGVSGVAGAMVAVYFDSDENTNQFQLNGTCTTPGAGNNCEANASDDQLVMVLGQGSDLDFLWNSVSVPDQPGLAKLFNTTFNLGSFDANLQILQNFTGRTFNQVPVNIFNFLGDGEADVVASGTIRGSCSSTPFLSQGTVCTGGPATPYDAEDKTDFHFSVVPEPATLTILGASLLGMGMILRRRRK